MWLMLWILAVLVVTFVLVNLGWRWASRIWSLPCPSGMAWFLENPIVQRLNGTRITVERLGLQPGQRVLEIGPGPGRLLIPAARAVLPGGEAVGIDIQPRMLQRLQDRANREGITNLTTIQGDAAQPHVAEGSFDVVFLCTCLGEIPERAAAMTQCFRALKPGGILSITELWGDPHYQSQSKVQQLAEAAGFQLRSVQGRVWFYTATFCKP